MAGTTGIGTTFSLPNYHGELLAITPAETPSPGRNPRSSLSEDLQAGPAHRVRDHHRGGIPGLR